ncbi:MAG: D-hexose-6-phosphate mutarotase [Phycisphaerales bacterium]|nr:D-hexose-6-phosphate mutarotase [Phycisphaerales bacterium]
MTDVTLLNKQFGIPGVAQIVTGNGGLPAVQVTNTNDGTTGTIYLHGGHVTAWKPAENQEVLWCSKNSWWEPDKPIRGGVPICFPWFGAREGDATAPSHGFARILPWELESVNSQSGEVTVVVSLKSSTATRKYWPDKFLLRHRVTFGPELVMQLELTNLGNTPMIVEEAQHTYFHVGDVRQIRITGLENVKYISSVENVRDKSHAHAIVIEAETDRRYVNTTGTIVLEDRSLNRRITLKRHNSKTAVVWNPWIAKAKAMPDFSDEEWPEMMCIETANVRELPAKVGPQETHVMASRISVQSM